MIWNTYTNGQRGQKERGRILVLPEKEQRRTTRGSLADIDQMTERKKKETEQTNTETKKHANKGKSEGKKQRSTLENGK